VAIAGNFRENSSQKPVKVGGLVAFGIVLWESCFCPWVLPQPKPFGSASCQSQWKQNQRHPNPIPFRSWNDICQPTNQGSLGIRNMEIINQSIIIQSTWNVATNKNPFLSAILKSKYFLDSTFWTTPTTSFRSVYWSSILQVKYHLHNNTNVQVHKGNSSIWSTPWNQYWDHMHDHLLFPITNNPLRAKIYDLWLQDSTTWDHQLLSSTFNPPVVQAITSL
jgi:hypothetical protein